MRKRDHLLFGATIIVLGFVGCSSSLILDKSTDAFAASDLTLVSSCDATPGPSLSLASGVDSCHFTAGDVVAGSWVLIAPPPSTAKQVTGGTVDVYYKDLHKSYPVSSWTVPIDFASYFGITQWSSDYDEGVVEALITLNWTDNQGINQITKFRSIAVLVVTAPGYERMPINSGNQAWGSTCSVQYSSAGRSSVQCK